MNLKLGYRGTTKHHVSVDKPAGCGISDTECLHQDYTAGQTPGEGLADVWQY